MYWCPWSKSFLVPVLMQDKDVEVILEVALRRLKGHLFILEQLTQDLVLDVAESIKSNLCLAATLCND
jgi:hypothetical protein